MISIKVAEHRDQPYYYMTLIHTKGRYLTIIKTRINNQL